MDSVYANLELTNATRQAIIDRVAAENRDFTPAEHAHLRSLDSEISLYSERLQELRHKNDRQTASVRMMAGRPAVGSSSSDVVHVRSEPVTYRKPGGAGAEAPGFFRDLLHAQIDGNPEARARIDRHKLETRAVGTSATAPGVVPPVWLFQEFALIAHGGRPWANQLRRVEISDANPVQIGRQTGGAVVGAQVNQGDVPSDGSFVANVLTTNPATLTGKVDVSRQIIDGSNPAVDGLVYADCMGSYNEAVESAVVAAFEALTPPVTITYPGTYTNLPDAFIDANASVVKRRKNEGSTVFCSAGAWAYIAKQKDTAGRPLITTGFYGPTNSYGVANAVPTVDIAGEVAGLRIAPSWAQTTDNHLWVARADDFLLLESPTFNFRYEEVLGPSAVRLGVWGYAAPILGRYATSAVLVNAGSTIPAPAEAEEQDVTGGKAKK
jgi:HK97 family phage major capsid protein